MLKKLFVMKGVLGASSISSVIDMMDNELFEGSLPVTPIAPELLDDLLHDLGDLVL
jgi:hypothetical protein